MQGQTPAAYRAHRYRLRHLCRVAALRRVAEHGVGSVKGWGRVTGCGRALGDVELRAVAGEAYVSGVATCGQVWTCRVCEAKIRRRRADEVEVAADWWRRQGGVTFLLTLTVRHSETSDWGELVAGVVAAGRRLKRSRAWDALQVLTGGHVRALETTVGAAGLHPHHHLLLLVRPGCEESVYRLEARLAAAWAAAVVRELGESARPGAAGCDVRKFSAASYVAKLAKEVTRLDLKGAARSVWSMVDAGDWDGWARYAAAMFRVHSVQWSHGLRAACGLGLERSDAELAAEAVAGAAVQTVDAYSWNRAWRRGRSHLYLEVLEGSRHVELQPVAFTHPLRLVC